MHEHCLNFCCGDLCITSKSASMACLCLCWHHALLHLLCGRFSLYSYNPDTSLLIPFKATSTGTHWPSSPYLGAQRIGLCTAGFEELSSALKGTGIIKGFMDGLWSADVKSMRSLGVLHALSTFWHAPTISRPWYSCPFQPLYNTCTISFTKWHEETYLKKAGDYTWLQWLAKHGLLCHFTATP